MPVEASDSTDEGSHCGLAGLQLAIEAGDRAEAVRLAQHAIDDRLSVHAILQAMAAAMDVVGERFQRNEIFVPEMLIAARATRAATAVLEPMLVDAAIPPRATAVIGTVRGDLHDIGKNLVAMMWKGANIAVVDLGTNVPPEQFVTAALEHGARLIGLSALLTTTMAGMRDVVEAVRAADLHDTMILVGGAPVTAEFALRIGADGYAPDGNSAVHVALAALGLAR